MRMPRKSVLLPLWVLLYALPGGYVAAECPIGLTIPSECMYPDSVPPTCDEVSGSPGEGFYAYPIECQYPDPVPPSCHVVTGSAPEGFYGYTIQKGLDVLTVTIVGSREEALASAAAGGHEAGHEANPLYCDYPYTSPCWSQADWGMVLEGWYLQSNPPAVLRLNIFVYPKRTGIVVCGEYQ